MIDLTRTGAIGPVGGLEAVAAANQRAIETGGPDGS
jgi:hypothetical protein